MFRRMSLCLALSAAIVPWTARGAETAREYPPSLYEVMIDGESFQVEANRAVKLQSKTRPGVSYNVAIRIAPTQRMRLRTLQFNYDLPAKAAQLGDRRQHTVRLTHELGYNMLITDLGGPLDAKGRDEALQILLESVTDMQTAAKSTDLEVGKPQERKFGEAAGRGVVVHYRDAQQVAHTCLIYVLSGEKFTASCIAEYLDHDRDDVLPQIRKTLDSIRPVR